MSRVLIISSDILPLPGLPTTGAGLRAWGLGQGLLVAGHQVQFAMPETAVNLARTRGLDRDILPWAWTLETLEGIIDAAAPDVIVACNWPVMANIHRANVPLVLDQHGPHLLERVYTGGKVADFEINARYKRLAMSRADFFTCAGHRQRLYFLPWLMQSGFHLNSDRIASIPVSLYPELPKWAPEGEVTFVYGGVFLPWQDPTIGLEVLVERLEASRRGRLKFFGGNHPVYEVQSELFDVLRRRLIASPRVQVLGMVSRNELIRAYTRAHVAIDLMQRNPERELAFTTRTVEYLWCGLPVIYNNYAELADYIHEYQAGWTLDPDDREGIAAVIDQILDDPELVAEYSRNAQRLVRERLTWDQTIEPLAAFCRSPSKRQRPSAKSCFSPTMTDGETKTIGQLVDEAIAHYRHGGASGLARETIAFLRRRLARR